MSSRRTLHYKVGEAVSRVAGQYAVLRLDGEINEFCQVPTEVLNYVEWVHRTRRGLFAYAVNRRSSNFASSASHDLRAFDEQVKPGVPARAALDLLVTDEEVDGYLSRALGYERPTVGGTSGDEEASAFAAAYFRQHAVRADVADVRAYSAGVRGLFLSFVSAISQCGAVGDHGVVLAPVGIDEAWCEMVGPYGASVDIKDDLTGPVLGEWLARDHAGLRAVYVPVVNPLTGQVLTRRRARDLADVVLQHNRRCPDKPVFVFSDASAIDSCHSEVIELDTQPMGAIAGADLGDVSLGGMSAWTLDVVSSSMVLPTSNVVYAVTQNRWLRHAVDERSATYGHASKSAVDELIAAAALCLPPRRWFDEANDHTSNNLRLLREAVLRFNSAECGFDGLTIGDYVDGGWHTAVRFHRRLLPLPMESGFDVFTALLEYHCTVSGSTRVAVLPGELFGWSYDLDAVEPYFVVRVNLSVPTEVFQEFLWQLGQTASALWQKAWGAHQHSARLTTVDSGTVG